MSLTKDLIFGVSVLSETGWVPLVDLTADERKYVRKLVDHNPSCPFLQELQ